MHQRGNERHGVWTHGDRPRKRGGRSAPLLRSDDKGDSAREQSQALRHRRVSETRLQAAVVPERKRDDVDPYADVPCTD